jgi:hypothetical protein
VVLADHAEPAYLESALAAGALGCVRLLTLGYTNQQIASRLSISRVADVAAQGAEGLEPTSH